MIIRQKIVVTREPATARSMNVYIIAKENVEMCIWPALCLHFSCNLPVAERASSASIRNLGYAVVEFKFVT